MGDKTEIAWTDATWNPLRGCTRVSSGCVNCYAEKRAYRILQQQKGMAKLKKPSLPLAYDGTIQLSGTGEPRWTGNIQLAPWLLDQPLRWQKPRLIFANSMSDLFHRGVPFEYIDRVFAVMQASPHHTFQVLTKRPERALEWVKGAHQRVFEAGEQLAANKQWCHAHEDDPWPLKNVWFGVSAEDQATADERVPILLQIDAYVKWVSYEPAIGEIDFDLPRCDNCGEAADSLATDEATPWCIECDNECSFGHWLDPLNGGLNWIVVGGESGVKSKVRPFNIEWARSTIEQCAREGVSCFVKQLGTIPYQDNDFPEETPYTGVKLIGGVEKPGLCFPPGKGKKGGDMEQWPKELRVRQWPNTKELEEVA